MPVSLEGTLSWVGKILREKRPMRVLDIGVGMGLYGMLVRQLCDWIYEYGYLKQNWKVNLVGIEVFPSYIQDHQRYVYNKIILKDIREINLLELGKFDMVLMIDIIEHLEYKEAVKVVSDLKKISKYIIISSPGGFVEQRAIGGNDNEKHLTGWVPPMLENKNDMVNHKLSDLGKIEKEEVCFPIGIVLLKGEL